MGYFKHPAAIVESTSIGEGTSIWAFAHVLAGAKIGRDCNICDHVFIEKTVVVGDRVTIKCGVQLWDGVTIEDDVFIGPNATFTDGDLRPTVSQGGARTVISRGAKIGANTTIVSGITIGERAVIGAGSVVVGNVPANAVLEGNPARITGYVGASPGAAVIPPPPERVGSIATGVRGVTLHRLPLVEDLRGPLSFGEMQREVPFEVKRYFLVFDVSSEEIRGEHAHKRLQQFHVCVSGRCHIVADDGRNREEFILDHPWIALHVPPMVWTVQYKYSRDAVLMVLASEYYDAGDYIRDYTAFLKLVGPGA